MDEDFHPALFTSHESVEQAFYDAMERADLEAVMACWAEEDEIVCIHPNGARLIGHEAIRRSFAAIVANGSIPIRPLALHVQQGMMVAVHSLVEQLVVRDPGGTVAAAHVFATNVYAKTPNGWRMVLHHASHVSSESLPEALMDSPRPSVLH